jgi:hypothetical protein
MNKVFHVTRASIFLILASFASTAMSATVNSELGGASLDGAWGFGCSEPDRDEPDELYDEMEFLIYQGNKVESRLYLYASANGSCSGDIMDIESEGPFDIMVEDELVQIEGWLGEDQTGDKVLVDPPPRQDGKGLLNPTPLASVEIFVIPGEGNETGCAYMDDTDQTQNGLNWYLYRCEGEDDASFIPFLGTDEPLIKAELPVVGVIPVPAAVWLFGTVLIGFVGMSRRRKVA